MPDEVYCLHCGARTEKALYCSHCGAKLSYSKNEPEVQGTTKTCPSCGSTIPRAAKICSTCNSYLHRESAAAAPRPGEVSVLHNDARNYVPTKVECPRCGSEQVQKLSVIYESGVAVVDTSSVGFGVGATRQGLGSGFGAAATRGVQVTALAAKAAPPARRNTGRPFTWMFVCGCMGLFFYWSNSTGFLRELGGNYPSVAIVSCFAIAIIALLVLVSNALWNSVEWPKLYERWDQRYICTRCGTMLIAEVTEPKPV
jgi:predicted RNA-binding Zn-ribbon protein involved in translation (DUF1610 family)